MKTLIFFVFSAALLVFGSCNPTTNVDKEAEKANVKKVLDQFIQSVEKEDMDLVSNIVAHDNDMINFGTMRPKDG